MTFLFLFILGLCIGSFLNVIVDRLPREETIVKGRSHCDMCHHVLSWYDLVPIISFISLQGRCRYCHKKIGYKYPLLELCSGLSIVFTYVMLAQIGVSPVTLLLGLCFTACFIVIFFTDLLYGIIPDEMIVSGILLTIPFLISTSSLSIIPILSGIGAGCVFLTIYILTKGRGMGFGDVKFAFFMGFFLSWPHIIIGLYIAFLTGSIVSLILIVAKKKKFRGSTISFGPFLVLGTYVAWLFGTTIWTFISSHFL